MSDGAVTSAHPSCCSLSAVTRPSTVVTGPGWNPSSKWQASKYTRSGRLNAMKPMSSSRVRGLGSPGPCLSRPDPSSKLVHPAPTVTKIRGVGVPETSSTSTSPVQAARRCVPNILLVGGVVEGHGHGRGRSGRRGSRRRRRRSKTTNTPTTTTTTAAAATMRLVQRRPLLGSDGGGSLSTSVTVVLRSESRSPRSPVSQAASRSARNSATQRARGVASIVASRWTSSRSSDMIATPTRAQALACS